mgnify:FL=1
MEQSKTAITKAAIRFAKYLKNKNNDKSRETKEAKKVLHSGNKKD